TLCYFHLTGLWISQKQLDGTFAIVQKRFSPGIFNSGYFLASIRLEGLDNNGFTQTQAILRPRNSIYNLL
ncbi:MAG: hypothetical protein PHV32_01815, partial [Eubacteriales bacterium]|nr:hypothetical protein [Eubacteriales bacterium]